MATVGIAERLAYGRPLDPHSTHARVQVEPRAGTALAGRILLSAIFVVSGLAKLTDPEGAVGYMQMAGIPAAGVLVWIAGLAELAGGLAIATGFLARIAAAGLVVFLVITTYAFHDFWNLADAERQTQMVQFMKNLAILGGLGLLFAYGPGRYSIDGKLREPMQP